MPSVSARLVAALLRATGIISRRFAGGPTMAKVIADARARPLALPTARMRRTLGVHETEVAGRSVWTIGPPGDAPAAHLLFFHGGGYVFSAEALHWNFYAGLARRHGIAVTAPMYPLAPEHSALETSAFALVAYRQFLDRHDGPFVVGGDSAGAGLAAATVMAARDAGLRLPAGLLLICPWLDISGNHPDQPAIESRDCILKLRGIRDAGALYAHGVSPTDPRVSPIYADWTGLPAVQMFGGGDDILVTDARRLRDILPTVDYEEQAGLMHDWPLFFFPESRAAQARIAHFILAAD